MNETTKLQLTSRHQLVDLNKKMVNFKLDFSVQSLNDKEFEAVVLNQTDINKFDSLDNIEMKVAPKKISGSIIADNNKYENYFIVLRCSEPNDVEITTTIEEIAPKIEENLEIEPTTDKDIVHIEKTHFIKIRSVWG